MIVDAVILGEFGCHVIFKKGDFKMNFEPVWGTRWEGAKLFLTKSVLIVS